MSRALTRRPRASAPAIKLSVSVPAALWNDACVALGIGDVAPELICKSGVIQEALARLVQESN